MSSDNRTARTARRAALPVLVAGVVVAGLAAPAAASTPDTARPAATVQHVAAAATVRHAAPQAPQAAPARAADTVGQIANGLVDSRLYVTSNAGNALSAADRQQVESALNGLGDADVRAVVVDDGITQQQMGQMLVSVANRVGEGETYVGVTANGRLMAGISKNLDEGEINQIITRTNGQPLKDRIIDFGERAEQRVDENSASAATVGYVMLGLVIALVAAAMSVFLVSRRRRQERQAREMAELKEGVQEDVTLLGEDIARLDLDVMDKKLDPAIRADYERAMNSYDEAKRATDRAARPEEMQDVTRALEDGRFFMLATRARLAGDEVPERRAPCFFNPNHGPSVQDVVWAPPGGTARSVPACGADAHAVLHGAEPDVRMVPYHGGRRPYYNAGPAYAPYAGGYYYGYGGFDLLGGLMVGTMLGSMMSGGFGGYGGDMSGGFGGEGGDVGGGWDFGSGDFGGGGFGDFGGF
ncbi:hypothetical protein [Actinomadura sp. WAC 06369]|uniref:hypothetical protein n=1 Tax=Actinomadura sp. WAC 06369 TaxID=2203193 RepID=UPI000F79FACD|nr:hypothetical protein [Actinomadura sp. WAC 06369]RSN70310.1 hypothetical protein DMH08_06465 [Actinomadura sp. WAC 06369]